MRHLLAKLFGRKITVEEPRGDVAENALRQLAARLDEIDKHRWEMQHNVNLLREDIARTTDACSKAGRDAARGELEAVRRDMKPLLETLYGSVGAAFERRIVTGVSPGLADRFGDAEATRREEPEGR